MDHDTFKKVLVARRLYETLLTHDALERFPAKKPVSYLGLAEMELKTLADLWGFRLVPLTEQKEAA